LINAVIRHEVVWEVLEVYFVAIAVKGLVQPDSDVESPPAAQA
jgi:hypothetical protein